MASIHELIAADGTKLLYGGLDGFFMGDPCIVSDADNAEANARLIAAAPTMYEYVAIQAASGDNEAIKILEAINGST